MPDKIDPPAIWIDTLSGLKEMAKALACQPRIAIDTEANSLHAYREQVCLIQFSTLDEDYLVDPLALPDLSSLAPILADPEIEKVFHAASYDLAGLKRDFGFKIHPIFDTMQAARLLGYRHVSLEAMLVTNFGLQLDKRYQKVNWARRPLPSEWLNYARLDTRYLVPLRDILAKELKNKALWPLAQEEFARLARVNGTSNSIHTLSLWERLPQAQKLNERQLTVLKELCLWREKQAQRLNWPVFKVMGEKTLVLLAQATPQSFRELETLGLTARQIRCFGSGLLSAIQHGLSSPPIQRTAGPRPDQGYLARLETLRRWRQLAGKRWGLAADLILPREFMERIAHRPPSSWQELIVLLPDSPWRLEQFGEAILNLLNPPEKPSH